MEFSKARESNGLFGLLSKEIEVLKEILLSRTEKMRLAIEEAETLSGSEVQQWDELKNGLEAKIAALEGQLRRKEEDLHVRESAIKQREEGLATKLNDLERRLMEKEDLLSLLEKRNAEITNLRAEAERKVGTLEAQLQEKEESLHVRESAIKEREDGLATRLHELERRLGENEALLEVRQVEVNDLRSKADSLNGFLEERNAEIANLRAEAERKVGTLEAQLQAKEKDLRERESAVKVEKEVEESLAAKLSDLERRLGEKEALLEVREAEINDLRSKADAINVPPEGLITLQEEDAVTLGESREQQGEKARPGPMDGEEATALQGQMAAEIQRLTADIREKDVLLSAREMEVKMVKQSMEERVKELERIVRRQVGEEQKKSRLVSYVHLDKEN